MPESIPEPGAVRIVDHDHRCAGCGYNLRGAPVALVLYWNLLHYVREGIRGIDARKRRAWAFVVHPPADAAAGPGTAGGSDAAAR